MLMIQKLGQKIWLHLCLIFNKFLTKLKLSQCVFILISLLHFYWLDRMNLKRQSTRNLDFLNLTTLWESFIRKVYLNKITMLHPWDTLEQRDTLNKLLPICLFCMSSFKNFVIVIIDFARNPPEWIAMILGGEKPDYQTYCKKSIEGKIRIDADVDEYAYQNRPLKIMSTNILENRWRQKIPQRLFLKLNTLRMKSSKKNIHNFLTSFVIFILMAISLLRFVVKRKDILLLVPFY